MEIRPLTFSDDYPVQVRWWLPDEPCGVVIYFHGIQSHGGWYERSGAALAEAGFAVCMPDRRGSGLNGEPRGHCESLNRCTDDLRELVREALVKTGQDRVHLVGVSWGGKQAVWLAQNMPETVASITLVCPGLFPRVDLTRSDKFRVAMAMINDRQKHFDIPLNDPTFFTSNPEGILFVERDNLKLTQVSASFLLVTRRLDKSVRGFEKSRYSGGVHLFLAGTDRIIDNERTREWFEALPTRPKLLSVFPEGGHTLEFDEDPLPYINKLTGFIVEQTMSE